MRTASKPPEKATYVAPQSDQDWLRIEQRKRYTRSLKDPDYIFCKLWGVLTDPRNLRIALARVTSNKGRRTAGVDGITVREILDGGVDSFVDQLRAELRSGAYRPSPVRRVNIPKAGQPGKFRALGIPTVKDRVVQAAMKQVLEPIFEADFYPSSCGFRPGKSAHEALEQLRKLLRPREAGPESQRRLTYQVAIEGDIKACFDNIDHHALMERVRRRVSDSRVNRLIVAFLKSGALSEGQFQRTENSGTPQGGILSPLLANIALSAIEERYKRYAWPRQTPTFQIDVDKVMKRANLNRHRDRARGRVVFYPVRYADDFIILVGAPPGSEQYERARTAAIEEKEALATDLKEQLGLELSETKTLVTEVTAPLRFLGHHVRVRTHPANGRLVSTAVIPKDRSQRLRQLIKDLFRSRTTGSSLEKRLQLLNPLLRGWGNFYRHAWGAKRIFTALDHYVWWTIYRWLRKKHRGAKMKQLRRRYTWRKPGGRMIRWRDGNTRAFDMRYLRVGRFMANQLTIPDFKQVTYGEPGA